ncbi:MAG: hypothetical protein ACOCQC_02500 [Halanaerobiaceae bacterium]
MMVLLVGSANSKISQVVKQGGDLRFYIGRNIILFGYHIHHFYFGILLISIAGWLSLLESKLLSREKLALMYGAGLGLLMDEIGLLLTWGDYYSSLSYLLSLFLLGIFFNVIYFPDFWKKVRRRTIESRSSRYIVRAVQIVAVKFADRVTEVFFPRSKWRMTVVWFSFIMIAVILINVFF